MYKSSEYKKILSDKFGWKDYGEKHGESVFTSWFQNYFLFERFGIDKRKAHLSSLIISGQITREEALQELEKNPIYPVLGIEKRVMSYPKHEYTDYPTDEKLFLFIGNVIKKLRWLKNSLKKK